LKAQKQMTLATTAVDNPAYRFTNLYSLMHWDYGIRTAMRTSQQKLPHGEPDARTTCMSGSERGAEETTVRNHHIGASASTLRDCQPSREDRAITTRLVEAGKLLGISVLDHVRHVNGYQE